MPDERSFVARIKGNRLAPRPLSGGEPHIVEGVSGDDDYSGATRDGRSIFVFQRTSGLPVAVRRVDVMTGQSELLREISPPDRVGEFLMPIWITPDGRHLMYEMVQRLGDLYVIERLKWPGLRLPVTTRRERDQPKGRTRLTDPLESANGPSPWQLRLFARSRSRADSCPREPETRSRSDSRR